MAQRPPRWHGIERRGTGYRAVVSQGRGRPLIRKTFPLGTDPRVMQAWRTDTAAQVHVRRTSRATAGTLAADVVRYLAAVQALPTIKDRRRQMAVWLDALGAHRRRETLTATEIRTVRDRWLTTPRAPGQPPLAAATVNLRLRALSNLYRVLDGPRAENPVRDVDEAPEPEAAPRDLDYATIRRIFEAMPDIGRAAPGDPRPARSLTKIRLRILAYTGLPPAQLQRLRPADVDLDARLLTVPGRRKGAGTASAILPLIPPAVDAFRDLVAADGFGPFSHSSMWKSFAAAARATGVTGASPYSLRHSFATVVYDLTGDDHLVMTLLQHAGLKTSQKYRSRALARVLQRKVDAVGQHFGITADGERGISLEFSGVAESDADDVLRPKTRKTP
jgi:integrase/recombinase XerD